MLMKIYNYECTQVIKIYNEKLEERNRRKRFVIDRGLIDIKQLQTVRYKQCFCTLCPNNNILTLDCMYYRARQQERRRTKEEREFVGRLRPLGRFSSLPEYEALVEGVLRARRLKLQIELYSQYRAMGIRTLEQVLHQHLS